MSFPKYPKYKASGVEWLGDVPEHWEVVRLGTQGKLYGGLTGKVGADFTDEGLNTCRFVPFTNILNNVVVDHCQLSPVQLQGGEMQNEVLEGDLLFLMSSEDFDYLGFSAVVRQLPSPTYLNSFCKGFRPNGRCGSSEFLNYFCRSTAGRALISQQGFGFTRINLRTSALASTPIPSPPLPEQLAIAAFLDRETAKINELVEAQARLIELLKEKRQAVISHAVTKGLNPHAPMKPSGIEWLGDVPEHWEVCDLNHALCAIGDVDHFMPESVERGVPYLMTGDLTEFASGIDFERCKQVSRNDYLKLSNRIKSSKGDVVMARYATIGTASYIDVDREFLVSYSCVTIKPKPSKVLGLYIFNYFKSVAFFQGIQQQVNTNTQGNVGVNDLKKIKVMLPNLTEQAEIIEYLALETAKIDTLTAEAQRAITLLRERRSALISAAVTGQIDIRNTIPKEAA